MKTQLTSQRWAPQEFSYQWSPPPGASPLRVLHVVESFGGGVAGAVQSYAEITPELEHHILFRERAEAPLANDAWTQNFASVQRLPDNHRQSVARTRAVIDRVRPDVVHAHSSYAGLYIRMAKIRRGGRPIRYVYTPHAWAFLRGDKSPLQRAAFAAAESAMGRFTDVLAACGENEAGLARRIGIPRRRIIVVPNTVPSSQPETAERNLPPEPAGEGPLVVGSGRLTQAKGPEFFVSAIEAVRATGESVRAQWIGGGDPEQENMLRRRGIDVTGWTSPAENRALIGRADLYLHSALWDGFPLTILEACASGVPVVMRKVPSFSDLSWPIKLDSPQALAQNWADLWSGFTRLKLLDRGSELMEKHTLSVQRERLLQAYGISATAFGGTD